MVDYVTVGDEADHEFIFTKSRNKSQIVNAWRTPPPHEPMDRWVRCVVIGGKIVLGAVVEKGHVTDE